MDSVPGDAPSLPAVPRRRGRPSKCSAPSGARIVEAALAVFASQGFEGAGIREITARAAVDSAMVSHGFGSKLDLWKAVVDDIAAKVVPVLDAIAQEAALHPQRSEALVQAIGRLIDVVCDTPYLAQFVVSEAIRHNERAAYVHERLARPVQDSVRRIIAAAHPKGQAVPPHLDFLAFTFLGSIAIAAATRPFMRQIMPVVADDAAFKQQLKRSVLTQIGW